MSITLLHLIPKDPHFRLRPLRARLRKLGYDNWFLRRWAVTTSGTSPAQPSLIPGRIGVVSGALCGSDIEDWWGDAMDTATLPDGYFDALAVMMSCCSAQTDLNALDYVEAAGFARYSLVTTDPECELPLPPATVQALEDLLGTDLRQVIARY
ncbi:hypothetical protein AB0F09_05800 [Streptomyces olivaceus]|uniref:hypothetical protein n=1 Tax=Streptomyces olivaceus TaxID=47716 RepID=UPI0033E7E23D